MAMLYAHADRLFTIPEVAAGATRSIVAPNVPMRRQAVSGAVAAASIAAPAVPPPATTTNLVPFADVGMYKPLTIVIHEIWTGKYPPAAAWPFVPAQSMLATSAMKGILQTSAAPRALNFLTDQITTPRRKFNTVQAPQPGSPLICYIPAVTQNFYSLTVEVGFNTFNKALFDGITSLLSQAGTVPMFMPYEPYILAASTVAKLAGDVGKILFNAGIVLSHSQPLMFGAPGAETIKAGYYLVLPDTADGAALSTQLQLSTTGQVLDRNGAPYGGDVPYVVISIDGSTQDDSFKNFTPLAATADQLSTFFNIGDNGTILVNDALQGAQLINDLHYRQKADDLRQRISALPANSPQRADLQKQLDAWIANIQNSAMKPPTQ